MQTGAAESGSQVVIAGVSVDVETEASAVRRVLGALDEGHGGLMVTVNVDHLRRCRIDERYEGLVSRAEIVVADGMPLVWASRVRGRSLPERVAGANLVWSMCEAAAARGRRVFLLGGDPGTAEAAKGVLETRYPGLKVCGTLSPERGFENDAGVLERLEASVAESRPDIVLIALGSPKQEYLGERLLEVMPQAWFIGCGISFSFMSGHVRRAPAWMQRAGLEWLHRLVQEPRRLARRYLVEGIPFAASLLFGAFRERLGEAAGRAPIPSPPRPRRVAARGTPARPAPWGTPGRTTTPASRPET